MFRLTCKSILANKVRFALTTFGVLLAVSFVVGAFVLGDGLRSTFRGVSEEITAGVDLEVRNPSDLGMTPALPATTVAAVAAVDGVASAVGQIESAANAVRPVTDDGGIIPTNGPPQLAFNWIDDERLSRFRLVAGTPPHVGEFAIDVGSAARYGFVVGRTYELMVPDGRVRLRLSGTSSFGADNATLGAVLMQMNTAQAGALFGIDGVNRVAVRLAEGADRAAVQSALVAAVPGAEVVDHATVLHETTTGFTDQIDLVGNILLGFGFVALFVSAFIVYNTFAILLGQRTRELALLRTVGASPRQVRLATLGEAAAMGLLASAGGMAGGILLAKGIDALFGLMNVDLSAWPLIVAPRTIVAAAATGVGVTVLAALGPARRAATVPPVAALRGASASAARPSRRRSAAGLAVLTAGVAAGAIGLAGAGPASVTIALAALGAVAVVVGVTLLSPSLVGVATTVIGLPMRLAAGVTGRLAVRNAARNPGRTATTAAALMIGLALVSGALVVGASVKASIGSRLERAARADYYLTDDLDQVAFPTTVVADLRASGLVAAATGFVPTQARVDGAATHLMGFDFDQIDAVVDLDATPGAFDRRVADPVVVSAGRARSAGLAVGDTVRIELPGGVHRDATMTGTFRDQSLVTEDYLVDTRTLAGAGVGTAPDWIAVTLERAAGATAVDGLVSGLRASLPNAYVETADAFRHRMGAKVDQLQAMADVVVALAVIIALIGIANTLALSVLERTRELGMVRALGMTRRQVRRSVRYEAALVALFGAVLGVSVGLLFGVAVVSALPATFSSQLAVPVPQIAVVVLVATLAAVGAAWLPARRAGRLDVLAAIAH